MTIVTLMLRALGLPFCIFLGMLGYYEGVPVLRNIPFVDQIPIVMDLMIGRVAMERSEAASDARAGYVALSEKAALEAQLEIERKNRLLVTKLNEDALERAKAAEAARKTAHEKLDRDIQGDTGDDGAVWTDGDIKWLYDH